MEIKIPSRGYNVPKVAAKMQKTDFIVQHRNCIQYPVIIYNGKYVTELLLNTWN